MGDQGVRRIQARTVVAVLVLLVVLWVARSYDYAFFHTVAEMFAVTVAVAAFMVMWNSRRYLENGFLLLIGISFMFVGILDVLHLLTYRGVELIPGLSDDPPTQFWIAGRALQAVVFLIAPSYMRRHPSVKRWTIGLAVVTVALIATIVTGVFPSCLNAQGLTAFKIVAEFIIILLFLGALVRIRTHRSSLDPDTFELVSAAIVITAVSEAAFTLYRDPFGPMNLVGHFLRIIAFFLLYRATVVRALTEPYAVLFRELTQNAEVLTQTERQLRRAKRFSDAMNAIDAQINATFDLDEIMRRVVLDGSQAIGADSASIAIRESGSWVIRHSYRLPEALDGMRLDDEMGRHLAAAAASDSPLLITDATSSDLVDPEFASTYGLRTLISVPLRQGGESIGVLTFHKRHTGDEFSPEALDFAGRLASSLALAIDNARLYAAQRTIADTLQRPMLSLPTRLPGAHIAYAYRSADQLALIGGDFYDALQLDDEQIAFFVGDVSGKGMEAATASSMVRTTLRAFAHHETGPAAVLNEANRVLCSMFTEGRFATVTLCVLRIATGEVVLASAGHPDPYLCTAEGCMRHIADRDVPLGLFPDTTYTESRVTLAPGETILLHSDGLLDTRRGREFFGDARVSTILNADLTASPAAIISALTEATETFSGSQYTDDIALMAVRYTPEPS